MATPPKVHIFKFEPTGDVALAGFDEFETWMLRNDALYSAVFRSAEMHGLSETERLRVLLAASCAQRLELKETCAAYLQAIPPSYFERFHAALPSRG